MVDVSVLDLVPVIEGETPAEAFPKSLALARHAEQLGYKRYWVAEHHNMTGIASAATSVVIGYIAGGTKSIRVGAGGIMLPNHSPLIIAEQFGTLESLYPGRIDLGLGRAPGTDMRAMMAMRRDPAASEHFPQDVLELQALFRAAEPGQPIQAVPGAGLNVPLWILGSSLFGGQLAAELGLPHAFASHFAPDALLQSLAVYRRNFKPSEQLQRPHAMPCINVIAADTDEEARYLFTTLQMRFTDMVRGRRGKMQPPIADIESYWQPHEKAHVQRMLAYAFAGSRKTIAKQLAVFLDATDADEVMASAPVFDHKARLRSYEIFREAAESINRAGKGKAA